MRSRPDDAELGAIRLLVSLCHEYKFHLHIVHLSTGKALPELSRARAEGLGLTVETCPHYLHLAAESVQDGATLSKCAPPMALPVVWTEARNRGFSLLEIARWMAQGPARLAGCDGKKGRIAAGYDADFVIFDSEREFVVTEDRLHYRHRLSPYLGEKLTGIVKATYLRGQPVFADGEFPGQPNGSEFGRESDAAG